MIDKLTIRNFKSVKELDIDCRRINLFIGDSNTGKSNILEALGLLSCFGNPNPKDKYNHESNLNRYLRFQEIENLFFNGLMNERMEIIVYQGGPLSVEVVFNLMSDHFEMEFKVIEFATTGANKQINFGSRLSHSGEIKPIYGTSYDEGYKKFSFLRYYKFLKQKNFPDNFPDYLLPPNGTNLCALVMTNKEIRELMNILFEGFDLNFMMKTSTKTLEPVKQIGNMSIDFPLSTVSDTLHQIIFFYTAMESNKNSTLVFDNPVATASPEFAKHFGEKIAFDDLNQYFISTQNLYLLTAILEKTPLDSLNVFITYLKDYDTRVRKLKEEEISVLLDSDPFFNVNYFLEEE